MTSVRTCKPEEAAAIAELLNRAYEVERSIVVESPDTAESIASDRCLGTYLVAVDEVGTMAGCVLVLRNGFVLRLAVEPTLQNRGIGRQLMNEAEALLAGNGMPLAYVSILCARPELRQYYERLGYSTTGETCPLTGKPLPLVSCHLIKMAKHIGHGTNESA